MFGADRAYSSGAPRRHAFRPNVLLCYTSAMPLQLLLSLPLLLPGPGCCWRLLVPPLLFLLSFARL